MHSTQILDSHMCIHLDRDSSRDRSPAMHHITGLTCWYPCRWSWIIAGRPHWHWLCYWAGYMSEMHNWTGLLCWQLTTARPTDWELIWWRLPSWGSEQYPHSQSHWRRAVLPRWLLFTIHWRSHSRRWLNRCRWQLQRQTRHQYAHTRLCRGVCHRLRSCMHYSTANTHSRSHWWSALLKGSVWMCSL